MVLALCLGSAEAPIGCFTTLQMALWWKNTQDEKDTKRQGSGVVRGANFALLQHLW